MFKKMFLQPGNLFLAAAVLLAINGVVFFNSEWPPASWPNVTFTLSNFGQQLLFCALVFTIIGLVYLALTWLTRRPMNALLGYAHFGISAAAIFLGMFLDYWFSVSFKKAAGEGFWHAAGRGLGDTFAGTVWAIRIFALAQLIFVINVCWSLVSRSRAQAKAAP